MAETEGGNQVADGRRCRSLAARPDLGEGKLARDDSQREHARDLIAEFVNQVLAEGGKVSSDVVEAINRRIAADRRADQRAAQRGAAPPDVPEAGSVLARSALPRDEQRDRHALKLRVLNVAKKEAAEGPREGGRVRPERAVQEGLRRGVRHLRRRSLQLPGRRLRVRPAPAGHRAAARRCRTSRPRRTRRSSPRASPQLFDMERLHRSRRAARPRQDLRERAS